MNNNSLDYYRNMYQITKQDYKEQEKELERYKLLNAMQSDIIESLNKRVNTLKHSVNVLENQLNKILKHDTKITIKEIKIK